MTPPPLVTVVTPSYNQGEFVATTIESVLTQDYPSVEYVVMDGGSSDGTLGILRSYGDRLRWHSGQDDGQSDAIHRGFALGSGSIVAWLNADDVYTPGAISTAVAALVANPDVAFVYGRAGFIDRAGDPSGDQAHHAWDPEYLLGVTNFVPQPATFFRRDAYEAVGGLSLDLHYVMDYDLWIRLGRRGGAVAIDDRLALIRMYPETKTAGGGLTRVAEMQRMVARHGRTRLPVGHEWDLVRAYVLTAMRAWRAGRRARAVRYGLRSIPHLAHPMAFEQAVGSAARRARSGIGRLSATRRARPG